MKENVDDSVVKADIKKLRWEDIPKADVWTFGFPCQDLSNAGKQAGLVLKCENCGEILKITPEEYTGKTSCPKCGCANMKAESRSGCFFEIMRLLDETEENKPKNMTYVILAENVRALTPYLPILEVEYKKRGYFAQSQLFNSKYWNVPQSRDRYAVVGTYENMSKEEHLQRYLGLRTGTVIYDEFKAIQQELLYQQAIQATAARKKRKGIYQEICRKTEKRQ